MLRFAKKLAIFENKPIIFTISKIDIRKIAINQKLKEVKNIIPNVKLNNSNKK